MNRESRIVAAALMLLLALTTLAPQPSPANQAQAAPASEQGTSAEETSRPVPVSRGERPTVQHVTVQGDTYGRWALAHCGNFNAWPNIQAANGWPEKRIPIGKTAVIACAPTTTPAATKPAKVATPATNGPTWVHPLASGARGNNPNCWHTNSRPSHEGVDIAQPKGTPIRAASAGTIHRKAHQAKAGYYVTINHGNNIYTQYHHMTGPSPLRLNAHVQPGQTIGYVGITGNADGYHLHFEVMAGGYGRNTNPAVFMRAHGINIGC